MGLFTTDWKIQVEKIQAPVYRVGALMDFLRGAASQLNVNGALLNTFDITVRKQAVWNGQKIVLQAALNDYFGLAANQIQVVTNLNVGASYIYRESELRPTYFYRESESTRRYFYRESEFTSGYNFTVRIPVGIYTAELNRRVIAVVNIYKVIGLTFNTVTY